MDTRSKDQILLEGVVNNDSKSLEKIYKLYFNAIQTFIINNNGNYDDARDVFQEAVIALYEKAKSGNFVLTSQLQTYIYSICKRLWLKRLSKLNQYSLPLKDNMEEEIAVEDDLQRLSDKNVAFDIMERTLNSIGDPCKSLLTAFYIDKKNMTEIAALFGYTNPENAKTQKYKCLMRLKKLFFAQYDNS